MLFCANCNSQREDQCVCRPPDRVIADLRAEVAAVKDQRDHLIANAETLMGEINSLRAENERLRDWISMEIQCFINLDYNEYEDCTCKRCRILRREGKE